MGRIAIEGVSPVVEHGSHPAKAVVGEQVPISATIWGEGHQAVAARVVWRRLDEPGARTTGLRLAEVRLDRFATTIVPDRLGWWAFRVEAWGDPWSTWCRVLDVKLAAGQCTPELANDLEAGARLLERVAYRPDRRAERDGLLDAASRLRDPDLLPRERAALARSPRIDSVMRDFPVREHATKGRWHRLWVDRQRALFGSWYELFPRSTGGWDESGRPRHGTFATAGAALDRIAGMGFDVVLLPPIHPIGERNRRGRNNAEYPGDDDVGSPWAVGSADGGHQAVHPELGTLDEFTALVRRARGLGIEVAMDLALRCAPDHPWVAEHPEWFGVLPDGGFACSEDPPRRETDGYPLNFDNDPDGLCAALVSVIEHWFAHGVGIFRAVQADATPRPVWHRLLWTVKDRHPEIVLLAEATRPARRYGLGRLGFSQTCAWLGPRTSKPELTALATEWLEQLPAVRPNVFVDVPDVPDSHREAWFALRTALAATLSPTWEVHAGLELGEDRTVLPDGAEHPDSEKYQLRPRDFAAGRSLEAWLRKLNEVRQAAPALRQLRTLRFHATDNAELLAYSKTDPATRDAVLCVVNLDPSAKQEGTVHWHLPALGLESDARFSVLDAVTGDIFEWTADVDAKLDPQRAVATIGTVIRG